MATQTAIPQITKLPPGPERPELHFNRRLHIESKYPVSAQFKGGDEWESPGIDFAEYGRMSTQTRKQSGERRLATPEWAVDDVKLRKVLVAYIETRAYCGGSKRKLGLLKLGGTEAERLARAQQHLLETSSQRKATLDKLCKEYVALKQSPEPAAARLQRLQIQIANLDTTLRLDGNIAAIVLGVVYSYYRRGMDSVGIGAELNMRPPWVRQMLWRLHRVWARMTEYRGPRIRINVLPREAKPYRGNIDVALAAQMRADGKTFEEISAAFGCTDNWVRVVLIRAGLHQPGHKGCYQRIKRATKQASGREPTFVPARPAGHDWMHGAGVQSGDPSYESYLAFCRRVEAPPMHEGLWGAITAPLEPRMVGWHSKAYKAAWKDDLSEARRANRS